MYSFLRSVICFTFLYSFPGPLKAQNLTPVNYSAFSKICMTKQRDSLKSLLVCPLLFTKKETQKKYKEIWDGRTAFITDAINDNQYVQQPEVQQYIFKILTDLATANPTLIKKSPLLLIDRSSSVNAYALGNNIIAVNLGLLTFVQSREEMALVLAHEMSHNILLHCENSMKERAAFLTSDEYINNVNAILESKYERYSRLKKIIEGYSFGSAKHNRYHEGEADSLAVVLLKNAHITFNPAFFLRLDSADLVYKTALKTEVKTYLQDVNFTTDEAWFRKGGKGLSSRKYAFGQEEINDSLKTHPDCKKRYETLLTQSSFTPGQKLNAVPASLAVVANKTIIWTLFVNGNLTAAMYRIFLEKDKGNYDLWHQQMCTYVLNGLFWADKKLSRFNAINIKSKEYISSSYLELQNLFEQIPRENLEASCKALFNQPFWQQAKADDRSFKSIMATLNFSESLSQKELNTLKKDFEQSYTESIYREFTEQIK
jgi:hypothetical protein